MNIYRFIKKLSEEEIKLINKQLNGREKNREKLTAEAELFTLVLDNEDSLLNDDWIARKLQMQNDDAFSKLKSRLFYRILDVFTSDAFLTNSQFVNENEKQNLQIKKRILQLKTLVFKINKTSFEVIQHMMSEITSSAKELEMYDSLVEVLSLKKLLTSNILGYNEFLKADAEIEYFKECASALRKATDYYHIIISNQNLISHFTEEQIIDFMKQKIKMLEADPYTTVSTAIQYYYKLILMAYYEKEKKYADCVDICLDILSLLNRSRAVNRKERHGFVHDNMGNYWMLQRNYDAALRSFRSAMKFYQPDSFPWIISKEYEFYACFYDKRYTECVKIIETMLSHDKRDLGEIRHDKFLYYQGCLEFMMGRHKEALNVSRIALQITKDKPRWEIGMRYLRILSLVELGEIADAGTALENLRKQIKRLSDNKQLEKRDEIIYKALREYEKCGFSATANRRLNYLLKKLGEKDAAWSWKFYSHELFPLHKWMNNRITEVIAEKAPEKVKVRREE